MRKIKTFETSSGVPIYQIPIEAFPGLWTYAYLVVHEDFRVLIDTGSGIGESKDQLVSGIQEAGLIASGELFSLAELTHVLITHGHIDHFGGLSALCSRSKAKIGVHELVRRNLTSFQERRTINLHILADYLIAAGVMQEKRDSMLEFYRFTKQLFDSVDVDFCYEEINMELGPFQFLHVPGHSGGHVVIRFDDILFCGDHILTDITPHQVPEQISTWCGLNHYLKSLDVVEHWARDTKLALGGHKGVIKDLPARITEIRDMHMDRLEKVLTFFQSPNTIDALSNSLFGEAIGFNALLAIEEAGAHVEYLYQRGLLTIVNYKQLENGKSPVALYYQGY
ncbi:MAG: MBL fold metallo-hydrolase [Anaerolineales bacterium]|nr:MBL fold metallo-hydrolase [Anaerolineales bacterium]